MGSPRRRLLDPCALRLEAPSPPYQILTLLPCHLSPRRIIKSSASPLIFKRKSPWPERPAQRGPWFSGAPRQAPNRALGSEKMKEADSLRDEKTWAGSGDARPHHTQLVALARRGLPPSTEPRPAGQRPTARQKVQKRRETRQGEELRRVGEASLAPTRTPASRGVGPHVAGSGPQSCVPRPPAPSPLPAHSLQDHRAARAPAPPARAASAGSAGLGTQRDPPPGSGLGSKPGGRSPARARVRAVARARSAGSSRIVRGSRDAAKPRKAHRGDRRGCGDCAGQGFYSGAATGGSPDNRMRVAAPPPGGASPPLPTSLV